MKKFVFFVSSYLQYQQSLDCLVVVQTFCKTQWVENASSYWGVCKWFAKAPFLLLQPRGVMVRTRHFDCRRCKFESCRGCEMQGVVSRQQKKYNLFSLYYYFSFCTYGQLVQWLSRLALNQETWVQFLHCLLFRQLSN